MPEPGIGLIYQNPDFIDIENLNFEYSSNSPCINSGNPEQIDLDAQENMFEFLEKLVWSMDCVREK